MLFYFSILFVLFVCSSLEINYLRKADVRILFSLLVLFLFVLSVIRWETGTDWHAYYDYFQRIIGFNQETEFEYGFARLNEIVKLTFDSYTLLLFVFAFIVFYYQTKAIIHLSPYPIFTLFFLWSMSFASVFFIRQNIATALLFYSVVCLLNKQNKYFFLFVGIAFLFHKSSIIFLLAYWIYKIHLTNKQICLIVFSSAIFTVILSLIISHILPFMGDVVQYKLTVYLGLGESEESISSSSLKEIMLRGYTNKLVILFFCMFYSSKSTLKSDSHYQGLLSLYVFGVFVYFLTLPISVVLIRFSFAFDIIQVILLPLVLKSIPYRSRLLWFLLWSMFLGVRFYITLYGSYYELYVPYKSIFSL